MTTESTLKDRMPARYALITILHLNAHPNNQLWAESKVAHSVLFLAMLHLLHSITNEEQYKKLEYTWYRKYGGKPYRTIMNWHLVLSVKRTGTQRRTKVSPWCMHCMSCDWWKGTSWDRATSNSDKIKPVATFIVKLCLAKGMSEWVSELKFG